MCFSHFMRRVFIFPGGEGECIFAGGGLGNFFLLSCHLYFSCPTLPQFVRCVRPLCFSCLTLSHFVHCIVSACPSFCLILLLCVHCFRFLSSSCLTLLQLIDFIRILSFFCLTLIQLIDFIRILSFFCLTLLQLINFIRILSFPCLTLLQLIHLIWYESCPFSPSFPALCRVHCHESFVWVFHYRTFHSFSSCQESRSSVSIINFSVSSLEDYFLARSNSYDGKKYDIV